MLRKFSAALIAAAFIASPVFVAGYPTGAAAATATATTTTNSATKTIKTVKHQHKPLIRHHVVAKNKRSHHVKLSAKPHRQHIVSHSSKTTKTVKNTGKTNTTSKTTKPSTTHG